MHKNAATKLSDLNTNYIISRPEAISVLNAEYVFSVILRHINSVEESPGRML